MKKRYATSVLTDIRNFTGLFEKFQYQDSDDFLEFIEQYYKIQSDIANIISDDIHMGTTGDGVLAIFLSKNSYIEGYAYVLAVHKALHKITNEFKNKTGEDTNFGIGADSGNIWKIGKTTKKSNLNTYVGSVINRSSRIESNTKLFADTKVSIGYHLYDKLIQKFYPAAYDIMSDHSKYDELLNTHPDVVLISKEFMLYYIFEMELRNMEKPLPIFRLSESMAKNNEIYWKIMNKLLDKDKISKLENII